MAYVSELDSYIQKEIEKELKKAIIETGFYSDEEIKEYVEYGMNSKVSDLEDTIDIYEVIKEKECELEEMGKSSKKIEPEL